MRMLSIPKGVMGSGLGLVMLVKLCRHHFRVWNLGGYHFTLIYFRLATILFNHCNQRQPPVVEVITDILISLE